jgi:hypothetical protein
LRAAAQRLEPFETESDEIKRILGTILARSRTPPTPAVP